MENINSKILTFCAAMLIAAAVQTNLFAQTVNDSYQAKKINQVLKKSETPADFIKRAEESYRSGKFYEALFNAKRARDLERAENAGKPILVDASAVETAADKIYRDVEAAAAPLAFKFWQMELYQIRNLDRAADADKNNAAWRNPNIVGYYLYRNGDKWDALGFAVVKGTEKLFEAKKWTQTEKNNAKTVSQQPKVVILNKKTGRYEVWNVVPIAPKAEDLQFSATQNRSSLKPDSTLSFSFENTRLNFDTDLIVPPKDFFADQEVIEIYDGAGLAMVERNKLSLLRGDKGIADVLDTEADARRFDEAKQVYVYFDRLTASYKTLGVVTSRRKLMLSKLYAAKDAELQKFVEEEMTKNNYTDEEKKLVRGK